MESFALFGQYQMEKTIGSGGFGKVKLATHVLTGEKVAIKIMNKQKLMEDLPRVKHEINALKSLSHSNICKLYQIVETSTHYFLVMEYCCGGELFDHIVEKEKLTENEARLFFQQIVSAVSYLHSQGFAHRDLKPENILLDKDQNLKLIDFGLAVKPENGLDACLYTSCGSPNYVAPELIKGEKYLGCEIDIWSLGVLLYALLCGSLPFEDSNIQKLYEKILSGYYEEKPWLSWESKSLLHSLLQVNAKKRITTEELKAHPWFTKDLQKVDKGHSIPKLVKDFQVLDTMSKYFNVSVEDLWNDIQEEKYDYPMATYLLLLDKKRNNEPIKLFYEFSCAKRKIFGNSIKQTPQKLKEKQNSNEKHSPPRTNTFVIKNSEEVSSSDGNEENQNSNRKKRRSNKRNSIEHIHAKKIDTFVVKNREEARPLNRNEENRFSNRKNCKRIRSPGLGEKSEPELKRIKGTPNSVTRTPQNNITPYSARKILDGIEKSFSKAKSAFSIRRKNNGTENQPVILWRKDLSNVSSTNSVSPEDVLSQLQNALKSKGITCTQKGYTLKGKLKQQSAETKDQENKLSFELEVCWIPSLSTPSRKKTINSLNGAVVGIRRKRLRGDAWIYKNVCEEVLALTAFFKPK